MQNKFTLPVYPTYHVIFGDANGGAPPGVIPYHKDNPGIIFIQNPNDTVTYTCTVTLRFLHTPGIVIGSCSFYGNTQSLSNRRSYINMYENTSIDGVTPTLIAREHTCYHTNAAATRGIESACTGIFYRSLTEGRKFQEIKAQVTLSTATTLRVSFNLFCLAGAEITQVEFVTFS